MLLRQIKDFGISPFLGITLAIISFIGIAYGLFSTTPYAKYLFAIAPLIFSAKLSNQKRNDFLKLNFKNPDFLKIRLIENALIALPFISVLLITKNLVYAVICLLLSSSSVFINHNNSLSFVIPTPFSQKPYEFLVGFRKMFPLFILIYTIIGIAISVNNFNLAFVAFCGIFLASMLFYSEPENEFYVWVFGQNSTQFLWQKIKTSTKHVLVLSAPAAIIIAIAFSDKSFWLILPLFLGILYLSTMIFAKYSAYPNVMSLPQGIMLAISFWLPLLLIFVSPYLYKKAIEKLSFYLK